MLKLLVVVLSVGLLVTADDGHPAFEGLEASPECSGEIRLSFNPVAADGNQDDSSDAKHVVKRDARSSVIGVSYRPVDASQDEEEMHKEFAATSTSAKSLSLLLRGLNAGRRYSMRVRHGNRVDEDTEWGEYSEAAEATSGMMTAESGPAGIGEGRQMTCQSRRRSDKTSRTKSSRIHRATFAKNSGGTSSRRRRYYYSYYSYSYTNYSYTYYYYGGSSLAGAIAGAVIGFIFIVSAIVICCKFYLYGGCGRQPYRRTTTTTTLVASSVQSNSAAYPQNAVPMTATVVPPAYTATPVPGSMESKAYPAQVAQPAYPAGAYAAAAPMASPQASSAYPAPPQATTAPAWGGMQQTTAYPAAAAAPYPGAAAAPYPGVGNAPPDYNDVTKQ